MRVRRAVMVCLVVLSLGLGAAPSLGADSGAWERVWGQDVVPGGGAGFEVCVAPATCQAGVAGGGAGGMGLLQGIAVDPRNGDVWVSDAANNRVQKFGADGSFLLAVGRDVDSSGADVCTVAAQCVSAAPGGEGGQFRDPMGIATDALGQVYVVDEENGRVQQLQPSGAFVRAWGVGVTGTSSFAVCTVAASCTSATPGSEVGGALGSPSGIAVGADGSVYVGDGGFSRVTRFTTSPTPSDVQFDRTWGKDVVSGGGTGFEVCATAASCKQAGVGALGGELNSPQGLAVAGDQVFVLDGAGNNRVQVFESDGDWLRAWGKDVVTGGSTGPEVCAVAAQCKAGAPGGAGGEIDVTAAGTDGLAFGPAGDVYVAEPGNHRVSVFGTDGSFRRAFGKDVAPSGAAGTEVCTSSCRAGTPGVLGGEFDRPFSVDTGPDHVVAVADALNNRVQELRDSSAGPATFAFSSATYSHGEQAGTATITVTRSGDLLAPVSVAYATSNGSALAGSDYVASSGRLTYAAGETSKTFTVQILDDPTSEADETVDLTLSAPSYGDVVGPPATAVLTIVDDDALNTVVLTGPTGLINQRQPTYTFTAQPSPPGVHFQCSVDSVAEGSFTDCSSPWTTPSLVDGSHLLYVRAVVGNPVTQKDPSPAQVSVDVDATAPVTTLTVTPKPGAGAQLAPGVFSGTVVVGATQTDAHPNGQDRCVVDGTAPASFDAMPLALCPVEVSSPGTHTVYAASRDQAGNTGVVVSSTFRILAVPDTIIDSGPVGEVYLETPYFGFRATVPGSGFQCRMDGAAFGACTNPYLSPRLGPGSHLFEVRAVSADGVPDPTPAGRNFNIGRPATKSATCAIDPFEDVDDDITDGAPPSTCSVGARVTEHDECGRDFKCVSADLDCPLFSLCTLSTKATWHDLDPSAQWHVTSAPGIFGGEPGDSNTFANSASCDTGVRGSSCEAAAQDVDLVVPRPNQIRTGEGIGSCYASRGVRTGGTLGPAFGRRLRCVSTVTYKPVVALQAVATGSSITLLVPGAGMVTVGAGPTPTRTAARGRPVFQTVSQAVTEAGAVTLKPRLTKKAKKKLKRGKKVKLTVQVSYRSPEGTVAAQTSRIVLQKQKKAKKVKGLSALDLPRLF